VLRLAQAFSAQRLLGWPLKRRGFPGITFTWWTRADSTSLS
jgi:hypothetical protein